VCVCVCVFVSVCNRPREPPRKTELGDACSLREKEGEVDQDSSDARFIFLLLFSFPRRFREGATVVVVEYQY
jgi:hypothetical protein